MLEYKYKGEKIFAATSTIFIKMVKFIHIRSSVKSKTLNYVHWGKHDFVRLQKRQRKQKVTFVRKFSARRIQSYVLL